MPRKKRIAFKRDIKQDLKFSDKLVAKLINKMMWEGKKSLAERIIYGAFQLVKEKKGGEPLELFKKALDNIKPLMEVRSRRVGGANYQVPVEVRSERKLSLGLRWLVEATRGRGEKTMQERLATEIMEALENKGSAVKKREDTHKMAEANRAFAHYKW
ncbi:MAG: 30S ribosomal protein S7 [Deltaproteobacteria bacterium RIFCSPLOWO2_12_FULL_44_12]|nr:MAG: 30S ribosomal protein S7 [Deltaproteobacteria bacterium RIFCSPHIGHO2_01_FULL_43_49]OGQ14860.1 MAG: 30S ribosomal protein S7 [Deltaproteobacteria bacterium RIFCSPHIGHO2_02_FULL_44_53]OGQ28262.1 MAG: 30S ribosomal protein S7 [Deltaproteobacteria bacterium RIFCSPHIGHO2_12_FULL_44_21]OGQ30867.1 MAG: 30S ribosomal protein S7 [Deltaproteobacteria bacterium RIFCSPLOWO2_01_FULL_45_74]OGQ42545.1 MAG: 30S ribosomal protein S7 [Deltaproteobacteria bacterium RIFCSPLOWO2_02_FULL_44_34]OGQ70256.1 MA